MIIEPIIKKVIIDEPSITQVILIYDRKRFSDQMERNKFLLSLIDDLTEVYVIQMSEMRTGLCIPPDLNYLFIDGRIVDGIFAYFLTIHYKDNIVPKELKTWI